MKILMINTLYPPTVVGGAERSVSILAQTLTDSGISVSVITLKPGIKSIEKEDRGKVNIYYLPLHNLYFPFSRRKPPNICRLLWHSLDIYNPFMARLVDEIISIEKPDILHTHVITGFSVSVWSIAKRYKLPVVHSLRDYSLLCPRSTMFKNLKNCLDICFQCKIFSIYKIKATNMVQGVIANSQFIMKRHRLNGAFSDVTLQEVIHSAFDPREILEPQNKPVSNELILGYLGRLEKNKGIELLLNIFHTLEYPNVHLWVGGTGIESFESKIKSVYSDPRINYLGFVKPKNFYPFIDLLIQPSLWHEPLSRTIIEAYSWGKPVLVSNRGGTPEIVEDGRTGFIFDPDNPKDLRDKIRYVIQLPGILTKMGKSASEKSKEFLPDVIAKKHITFYQKVLENN